MAWQQFRTTLLNSMDAFELYAEHEEELSGVSGADKAVMRQSAESKGQAGKWRLTVDWPVGIAILRDCDRESLRKAIWEGQNCIGTGDYDAEPIVWEILRLRDEKARLLGFDNFADYSCARRMAKTGSVALAFIEDLRDGDDRQYTPIWNQFGFSSRRKRAPMSQKFCRWSGRTGQRNSEMNSILSIPGNSCRIFRLTQFCMGHF
jgi:Zn-dependent oligopeptidase